MVRIINLRNYVLKKDEVLIRVDRRSVVGNPFYMHNESERDLVCDRYEEYFNTKINTAEHTEFTNYINSIIDIARTKDVALACWCYPKRCHASTIIAYINKRLS